MWVKLKTTKHMEIRGTMQTYRPGDWVDVSPQTGNFWIVNGSAEIADYGGEGVIAVGSGVIVSEKDVQIEQLLHPFRDTLKIEYGKPRVVFPRTMYINAKVQLRPELVTVGLKMLDKWQIAIPLWDYEKLADMEGEEGELEYTKGVIRDLRVPLYDIRLMFYRKCETIEYLFEKWAEERQGGGKDRLAFLRAVYQVKPFIQALPVTWTRPQYKVFP